MCPTKNTQSKCNTTRCSRTEGIVWWNHSTRAWYCRKCAVLINRANDADAQRLYGHALCTLVRNEVWQL